VSSAPTRTATNEYEVRRTTFTNILTSSDLRSGQHGPHSRRAAATARSRRESLTCIRFHSWCPTMQFNRCGCSTPTSRSLRTTHCNHWCVRQYRQAPPLVGLIELSKSRRQHRFHGGHKSGADEDRDDCHCSNTNTLLSMTDINVSIPLGLRAASINRELAKVAVDSSAPATRRIRGHRPDFSSGDGSW
jgi:hypothetical protein